MVRVSHIAISGLAATLLLAWMAPVANATLVQVQPGSPLIDVTLTQGQEVGVDILDIEKYEPSVLPDIHLINRLIAHKDPRIFQPGETLKGLVHLENAPTINGETAVYPLVAMMQEPAIPAPQAVPPAPQATPTPGAIFFRKINVTVDRPVPHHPRQVTDIEVGQDIAITDTNFSVEVGLVSRMVMLTDSVNQIQLVFPIGDGGLDMNVMGLGDRILTPLFQNATLQRSTVRKARTFPAYYRGEPYMPITNQHGTLTGVAFHITILEDSDWQTLGPNYLIRGFDSHGCMRLRLKDLREFFTIVEEGGSQALPVNVDYFIWEKDPTGVPTWTPVNVAHPYPYRSDGYMEVENFAPAGQKPQYQRDPKEHLVILQNSPGEPDLRHLVGLNGDEATDLHDFDDTIDNHHYIAVHVGNGVVAHPGGLDQGGDGDEGVTPIPPTPTPTPTPAASPAPVVGAALVAPPQPKTP